MGCYDGDDGDGVGENFFPSEGDLELSPLIGFWLLEERRLISSHHLSHC